MIQLDDDKIKGLKSDEKFVCMSAKRTISR